MSDKFIDHTLRFKPGTDARNHMVRCICGWMYSSTFREVRQRGQQHLIAFADEPRAWNDQRRKANMPPQQFYCS